VSVPPESLPLRLGTRVIEGYFKCPTAFAVTTSALADEYVIVIGGHRVTLTFPTANALTIFNTDLEAPDWHYQDHDDSLSRRPELAPFWGRIAIAGSDPEAPPKAVTVSRFRVAATTIGDDDDVREVGRCIAEALTGWWATVSAWIEILHLQDLSRLGPIQPGVHFHETTLWSELFSVHGHPCPLEAFVPSDLVKWRLRCRTSPR
jgi:hypothetical protein